MAFKEVFTRQADGFKEEVLLSIANSQRVSHTPTMYYVVMCARVRKLSYYLVLEVISSSYYFNIVIVDQLLIFFYSL